MIKLCQIYTTVKSADSFLYFLFMSDFVFHRKRFNYFRFMLTAELHIWMLSHIFLASHFFFFFFFFFHTFNAHNRTRTHTHAVVFASTLCLYAYQHHSNGNGVHFAISTIWQLNQSSSHWKVYSVLCHWLNHTYWRFRETFRLFFSCEIENCDENLGFFQQNLVIIIRNHC